MEGDDMAVDNKCFTDRLLSYGNALIYCIGAFP